MIFMGVRPLFLSALTGLFITGCSSIYTVKNFSSKEKLYEDFNKSARGNTFKITLTDGRTLTAQKGAYIKNDSLFFISLMKIEKIKINPSEIEKIKYHAYNDSSYYADVLLKNGTELSSDSVQLYSNNVYKIESKPVNSSVPLDKVKEASYKNIVLGIIPGFMIGTLTGFLLGQATFLLFSGNNQDAANRAGLVAVPVFFASVFTGIIWGWISGYNYVYRFNE